MVLVERITSARGSHRCTLSLFTGHISAYHFYTAASSLKSMAEESLPSLAKDPVINIVLDTIAKRKQALIFVNTRPGAEKTAEEVAKKIKESNLEWDSLAEQVLHSLSSPTKQCERLAFCVKKGIAFHHSGLTADQRHLIEDAFRERRIRIISCTPTLAAGVDLPAFRAIIRDLKRYGAHGMDFIPVLEYQQMAGRAGRPKYDVVGEALCIADSDAVKDEIEDRYINGEPEEILSKLAVEPVLRTYLLSLIASQLVRTKEQIMDFFGRTFWAFQYEDIWRLEQTIERTLLRLEEWEFIMSSSKSDFQSADALDAQSYRPTALGKRVAELYLDPLTANYLITCMRRADGKELIPDFAWMQVVSHTIEMRPLLRVKVKEFDTIQEQLARFDGDLLDLEPSIYEPEYDDFLASVKTALFINDWCDEMTEPDILEKYQVRPGEIRAKLDLADWLLYACEELARILQFRSKDISRVRFRIRYGVKEELLPLLKLREIGRVRARLLFKHNLKSIRDIKAVDIDALGKILGKGIAVKVKEQLDQPEVEPISKRKRKGQLGIEKWGDQ